MQVIGDPSGHSPHLSVHDKCRRLSGSMLADDSRTPLWSLSFAGGALEGEKLRRCQDSILRGGGSIVSLELCSSKA